MSLEQVTNLNIGLAEGALNSEKPSTALQHLYHIVEYALREYGQVRAQIWYLRIRAYRMGEEKALATAKMAQERVDCKIESDHNHLARMFRKLAEIELYADEGYFSIEHIEDKLSAAQAHAKAADHEFSFFMEGVRNRFDYFNQPFPFK